jgi:hypothetical protein
MKYPVLKLNDRGTDMGDFIDFWSRFYRYSEIEALYDERIWKPVFDKKDIEKLFQWKNGMLINGHVKKQASVDKVIARLDNLNALKANFDLNAFKDLFFDISAIWQLFILHIIWPDLYPIFDQHVYRAQLFMETGVIGEIRESNTFKLEHFYKYYLPFYAKFERELGAFRKLDMALWTFGKFLKTPYAKLIV